MSPVALLQILTPLIVGFVLVLVARGVIRLSRDDPRIWEREIRRFEAQDRRAGPPPGGIVFTGSSSIRFWATLAEDMAPLPALNRGFGGAQAHQVACYADRIVMPYQPRLVVFYAGENDLAGVFFSRRKAPAEVAAAYADFCQRVHAALPQALIFFISIKPPLARRAYWPLMQEANRLVREQSAGDARLRYIDVGPAMLDAQGRTRAELFRWDGIHLNAKGYAVWTAVVKPVLAQAWRQVP
jgi:lysophospholipase L1-like esterase